MYTTRQIVRKLVIGAVALAVAICITIFIRENMDVKDPESALPTLTVTMNRLRAKIEDDAHTYIKTVRGMGYIWTGGKV